MKPRPENSSHGLLRSGPACLRGRGMFGGAAAVVRGSRVRGERPHSWESMAFVACVTGSEFSIDSACQPLTSARIHMVVCDLVVAAQVEAVETERWTPSAGTVVVLAFRPVGEPPLF